jgi:hypothetical protein
MKLVITIDTEEDNWDNFSRCDNTCSNIEQLLPLQELFDSFKVTPTYLITYPVILNENSQSVLKRFLSENKCEIGTHCHPWNTPPFEEELNPRNTMLINLPHDLIFKKISFLHNAIIEAFGITPVSFRSGRFAFDSNVAKALVQLGYKVDTSITPYENWSEYHGSDFSNISPRPYEFSEDDIFSPCPNGHLMEIPPSRGFLQDNFEMANYFFRMFSRKPINRLRIIGILHALHVLNMASLCPEVCSSKQIVGFAKVLFKKKYKILNMGFHSTSLKAGLNQYVKTKEEEKRIFQRIKDLLQFAKDSGIESVKLSDCARLVSFTFTSLFLNDFLYHFNHVCMHIKVFT